MLQLLQRIVVPLFVFGVAPLCLLFPVSKGVGLVELPRKLGYGISTLVLCCSLVSHGGPLYAWSSKKSSAA